MTTPSALSLRLDPSGETGAAERFVEERIHARHELFITPYLDGFLFYNPSRQITTLLDEKAVEAVRRHLAGEALTPDEERRLEPLLTNGALALPEARDGDAETEPCWSPTSVTFSNTQKCTLRCKYCYAEGGRLDDLDIPHEIWTAAVEKILIQATDRGESPSVSFLGEGEATASWKLFTDIIRYFRGRCSELGVECAVSLSSNGVFSRAKADWIIDHLDQVTFSVDGVREVHDEHRVLPNGEGSFDRVLAVMRRFDERGKPYSIRSTVTVRGSTRLVEFVEFVGDRLACKSIHLEPVFDSSRVTQLDAPLENLDAKRFIAQFRLARQAAAAFGIELYYSGSAMRYRDAFCGASDASTFLVTSRGHVTSCNEVLQAADPRASLFHYGSWDERGQAFTIDRERVRGLGHLNVRNMRKCQGCIAKYNCAGDCYAKSALSDSKGDPRTSPYTDRCVITRELLKDNLAIAMLTRLVEARGDCQAQGA